VRVIVTGSRTWPMEDGGEEIIFGRLGAVKVLAEALNEDLVVVHGGADGADACAQMWVQDLRSIISPVKITEEVHLADWKQFGMSAGIRRNIEMADEGAMLCLAFLNETGGKVSRGTRHMIAQAQLRKILTIRTFWGGTTQK
jgi:hypothetical protein